MTVAGVLLAAGEGRRFGRPKATVEFRGSPLVERGLATLRQAGCDPVVVVLGAGARTVMAKARLGDARVVVNTEWVQGLATSLRAGLAALRASTASAAVLALVDQPLVTAAAVERLIAAWHDGAMAAACSYDGQRRNPVLLDRSVWDEVARTATGDRGARPWLSAHPDDVIDVPCEDVASPEDIDTAADLERLG